MLDKKKILILLSIALLILLTAVAVYFWRFSARLNTGANQQQKSQTAVTPGQSLPGNEGAAGNNLAAANKDENNSKKEKLTPEQAEALKAQQQANFFIEMLGTYSSDGKFKNIIDLQPLMTGKMLAWSNDFIERNSENMPNQYQSVTTKVFKSQILSSHDDQVVVLAQTRRDEVNGDEKKSYNQAARLVLKKVNSRWLVDEVNWQ